MPLVGESAPTAEHDLLVYDLDGHLIDELTGFAIDGLALGEAVVVVATPEHRAALADSLAAAGCSVERMTRTGQYAEADAAGTLATFLRGGTPDPDLFFATIHALLDDVSGSGRPVRVFGEMVAVLWAQGNVPAALELESLWNRLGRTRRFALHCAYPTTSFAHAPDLTTVRTVCELHGDVLSSAGCPTGQADRIDPGGDEESRVFVPTPPAVRAVRHLVTDTLRAWGQEALVPDAALLVSELATNALRHATSPFRVRLTRSDRAVRIAVEDLAAGEPRLRPTDLEHRGGRGVALIDAMALSWGCEPVAAGKVVWCELPVAERAAG